MAGSALGLRAAACRGPAFAWVSIRVLVAGSSVPPAPGGTHIPKARPTPGSHLPKMFPTMQSHGAAHPRGMEGSVVVPKWEQGCRDIYQSSPLKRGRGTRGLWV